MKLRRFFALMICLALALGLAAPVLAEEGEGPAAAESPETSVGLPSPDDDASAPSAPEEQSMDDALADLTLKVKELLDVDDGYTDFSSDYYDGPDPMWSLRWTDGARQLSADVRPDGTVLSVNFWAEGEQGGHFYGFDPAFPEVTADEAMAQAEDWCERLFTGAESAVPESIRIYLGEDGYYRIGGTVQKNGLPSPITFTMIMEKSGLTSFYRSDRARFVGELPAAEAEADASDAAAALAMGVELELRWVLDGADGAKLMYVPVGPRMAVDAQSGEAVDMDALYASLAKNGESYDYGAYAAADTAEAEESMAGVYLTETELASIENYGDVLDQDAVDETLRKIEALGLDSFEMVRCSYSMDSETGDVTASVRYTAPMTEDELYGYSPDAYAAAVENGLDMTIYKYFTLDAKSGELMSVSTSYPLWDREESGQSLPEQAERAEAFLDLVAPALAAEAAGCTLKGYDERDELVFAQVHEGYFYPENYLSVHVDSGSGVVDAFHCVWDEDVTFGQAEDIISQDEALAAYTDALDVTLGYVAWPVDVTAEDGEPYADYLRWGYTYVEQLRLGYYFDGTDEVQGVDALSGEVRRVEEQADTYAYDDLEDVPEAEQIELLGAAGVGFAGGKFLPEAELTNRDAVMLLLRAEGVYAMEDDDQRLAEQAYYEGFLASRDADLDETVSRIAFLRMLIGASKYGYAAGLTDVWDAGFADVDAADEAVAAIARALGMAEGDALEPETVLTRAGAAALLYRFMDR